MGAAHKANAENAIRLLSAQIHAATAQLASMVAVCDQSSEWADVGVRSCAHWLTINAGFDLRTSSELVRVGHALEQLPLIAAAFRDGRLSFDKVRALTRVATSADDAMWLEIGLQASGSQLARICRAVRSALDVSDPRRSDDELAHRGFRCWWRDDGMLEVLAVLPREDGAAVMAAVDAVARELVTERQRPSDSSAVAVSERLHLPVLRADAIVRICESYLANQSREPVVAPTRQMVVHVDASVLQTDDDSGRSHIEDGPWLAARSARWLACDSDVVVVAERTGKPVDIGRATRVIPSRLRLALQVRDRGCRYPGCGVPARGCEGHHIRHWLDGGPTDMENLICLCRFHHRRHHEGKFRIRPLDAGEFAFERSDGTPIVPPAAVAASTLLKSPDSISADSPVAAQGGEACDLGWTVSALADAMSRGGP